MRRFTRTVLVVSVLALVVAPVAFALRFTDDSYNFPTATVGQPYSKQLNGAGGCGPALPYQYTLISGNLPPGISLSFGGLVSGTPAQVGSYSFWVNLSDQNPPTADWCRPSEAQREFTILVQGGGSAPATALSIVQSALSPNATTIGSAYDFQLTANGGGTQTWSLQSGSLPAGLQLSATGLLSGTPTTAGDSTFKVQVSDGTRTATQSYTLTVVPQLKIAPVSVPTGEAGRPFDLRLSAAGGRAGYSWSVSGGTLPTGLVLDEATGVISGSPTAAGSFPFKLSVTDSLGFTDSVDVTLVLAPRLAITTRTLRAGRVGHAFAARIATTGGVQPRTWKLLDGALPSGLHFSKRMGAFSGTPRRAGNSRVVVRVTDALGAVSRVTFVLHVRA